MVPKDTKSIAQLGGGALGGSASAFTVRPLMKALGTQAAHMQMGGSHWSAALTYLLAQLLGTGGMAAGAYGGYKGTGALYDKLQVPNKPLA